MTELDETMLLDAAPDLCPYCGSPLVYGNGDDEPPIYCESCGVGWERQWVEVIGRVGVTGIDLVPKAAARGQRPKQ